MPRSASLCQTRIEARGVFTPTWGMPDRIAFAKGLYHGWNDIQSGPSSHPVHIPHRRVTTTTRPLFIVLVESGDSEDLET